LYLFALWRVVVLAQALLFITTVAGKDDSNL
jgi:hypothetical protein